MVGFERDMENLFNDLGIAYDEYLCRAETKESKSNFVSAVIYMLSNGSEEKYNALTSIAKPDVEQICYAIIGNSKTKLVEDKDRFMWILRYGLCDGDEDKTKRVFEIVTGKVAIDINFNFN